jgi:hypothetical protein
MIAVNALVINATKIKIYRIVVIIMDILKYCFGIDPTRDELERIRRMKQANQNGKPLVQS